MVEFTQALQPADEHLRLNLLVPADLFRVHQAFPVVPVAPDGHGNFGRPGHRPVGFRVSFLCPCVSNRRRAAQTLLGSSYISRRTIAVVEVVLLDSAEFLLCALES